MNLEAILSNSLVCINRCWWMQHGLVYMQEQVKVKNICLIFNKFNNNYDSNDFSAGNRHNFSDGTVDTDNK